MLFCEKKEESCPGAYNVHPISWILADRTE
jgi:hypothetical protein